MNYISIVPKRYRTWCPLPPHSKVICLQEMLAEESEDMR